MCVHKPFPLPISIRRVRVYCVCFFFKSNLRSLLFMCYNLQFIGTGIFTVLIYLITSQPLELNRFGMFFAISICVTIVGQSIGLMVGAWFDVVVSYRDDQHKLYSSHPNLMFDFSSFAILYFFICVIFVVV